MFNGAFLQVKESLCWQGSPLLILSPDPFASRLSPPLSVAKTEATAVLSSFV